MDARKTLLEAPEQVNVVVKRQIGMQTSDDVELGHRFRPAFARLPEGLVERHGVGPGRVRLAAESAERATGHAHVGGVEVAVNVEVGGVAVELLANVVGQVPDGQQVVGVV